MVYVKKIFSFIFYPIIKLIDHIKYKKKIKELCDFRAKIDMQGEINSLNVGASVAAVLFERLKQIKEQK